MTDKHLEKYELKIENLPWINSNRDQKELEFVLNIDLPSESVKVKIKEAGNCKDIAYVRCDSKTTFKKLLSRSCTRTILFQDRYLSIKKSDRIEKNSEDSNFQGPQDLKMANHVHDLPIMDDCLLHEEEIQIKAKFDQISTKKF